MPVPTKSWDFGDGLDPIRLTDKQYMFVECYLTCFNATEAARQAGYRGNDKTLAVTGWQNLRKPNVAEAIRRRLEAQAMQTGEALKRVADIARGNMAQFLTVDPSTGAITLDMAQALKDGAGGLIKSIDVTPEGKIKKVELYPKDKALDMILKAAGAYSDGVTVNLPPFDPAAWEKKAKERLQEVEDMPDIYPEGPHEGNES